MGPLPKRKRPPREPPKRLMRAGWRSVVRMRVIAVDDVFLVAIGAFDEARLLREEAQSLLASYEAKAKEVTAQSARIVEAAKAEAQAAATQAKLDLAQSITRRVAAAEEQIGSTVKAAEAAVRERAIAVSVAVAADVLKQQMSVEQAAASIDASIGQVGARLH